MYHLKQNAPTQPSPEALSRTALPRSLLKSHSSVRAPDGEGHVRNNVLVTSETCISASWPKPPSSGPPSASPTSPAAPPRSSCGLIPTWCASRQEPWPSFSLPPLILAALPFESLPTLPFAPAPFCAVRLRRQFGSVPM